MANIGQPEKVWEVVPQEEPQTLPRKEPIEDPLREEEPVYVPTRRDH